MSLQPTLFSATREHDLPPRWDGHVVEWRAWSSTADVRICPPPKPEPCSACRSLAPQLMANGTVWLDLAAAGVRTIRTANLRPRSVVAVISAFRCTACGADQVLDGDGQLWDLDDTDYVDEGSWPSGP